MSRRDLLTACQRLRIRTDHVAGGQRGSKDNNWLRMDIVERCYGPGLEWMWKTAAEADQACVKAAACCAGDFGYLLSVAQRCQKNGNDELTEYKRLRELKRRKSTQEMTLLRSARQWFDVARIAQELHQIETVLREAA